MRWIAVFLTTILAANAVSLDQFYGDRSCSCSRCGGDQCCEDKENYNCIYCDDIQDLSSSIDLTDQSLLFYGENYIYAYISTYGIILLSNNRAEEKLRSFTNDTFPITDYVFFAPFYGNITSGTNKSNGTCYSRASVKDNQLLNKAKDQIQRAGDKDFSPEYLLIATWDNQNDQLNNTFQCVIATNGTATYAIFLYNKTESTPAKVGFNDGIREVSWEIPCSGTKDISMLTSSSNVGEPGMWVFRVDGTDIIPACPNEDDLLQCENDVLCSCLTEDVQQKCQCPDKYSRVCKKENPTTLRPEPLPTTDSSDPTTDILVPLLITFLTIITVILVFL